MKWMMVLENLCGGSRALCVDSGRFVTRQASGCTDQEAEAKLLPVFSQRKPHLCKLCAFLSFIFAVSLSRSHKAGRFWWEVGVWRANTHNTHRLVQIVGSVQGSGTREHFHRLGLAWLFVVGTNKHTHPLFDPALAAVLATRRPSADSGWSNIEMSSAD